MNHNDFQVNQKGYEYDECISRGICSISPTLSSLQEVIMLYLKELAFYLLELQSFGIDNEKIKDNIIEVISGLIVNVEYKQDQFNKIIERLYGDLVQAKDLYILLCKKNNMEARYLKSKLKISKKMNLTDAIRQGHKYAAQKVNILSTDNKSLFELMLLVIKSICVHIIELKELGVKNEESYKAILSMLSIMNFKDTEPEKLNEILKKFTTVDNVLLQELQNYRERNYGEIVPTEVSSSTRPNKAILVSGTNVRELELLLNATKDRGIDVYTHGHMIMAHSFPKLKAYPHLVGHFGKGLESYLLDFAAFPGAILMTRHSFQKVEKLFRSRVFTTDTLAPSGVVTIKDNNYEPLIESALSAKGFSNGREGAPIKINLQEKAILKKITEVAEKIEQGVIKHFFFLGISNHSKIQKEYFEKFLKLLGDDCFVLSFSYTNGKDNVLLVESDYGFPLVYKSLDILTKKMNITALNPIFLYTRCEVHTISNVLHMKYMGVKTLYFTNCSPNLINPALVNAMKDMFNIKSYTTPENDLKDMLSE